MPTSPEPNLTKDGGSMFKSTVNNGTELWEANLRNGGQPPPQQQVKTPWGHTPSTNIGGTWGEDDEAADSSNMWTGAPAPSQPNTPQWPGAATGNQTGMWGGMLVKAGDANSFNRNDCLNFTFSLNIRRNIFSAVYTFYLFLFRKTDTQLQISRCPNEKAVTFFF